MPVTLLLPADTKLPVVVGAWSRVKDRIRATYTVEELAWSLACINHPAGLRRLVELGREKLL